MTSQWIMLAATVFVLGCAGVIFFRYFETEERRAQRIRRKMEREVKAVATRISAYGQNVHKRFPSGDVVVGERDLAEQLRKKPAIVATALNVLLSERRVQKSALDGYWKLNV